MNKEQFSYLNCARGRDKTKPQNTHFNVAEGGTAWTTDGHRVHILSESVKCSPVLRCYSATSAATLSRKIRENRDSDHDVDEVAGIDHVLSVCEFTGAAFTITPKGEETISDASNVTPELVLENCHGQLIIRADLNPFGIQRCPLPAQALLPKTDFSLSTNARYLFEALGNFSDVTLGPGPLDPFKVSTWIGGKQATSIIMPMRLPTWLGDAECLTSS